MASSVHPEDALLQLLAGMEVNRDDTWTSSWEQFDTQQQRLRAINAPQAEVTPAVPIKHPVRKTTSTIKIISKNQRTALQKCSRKLHAKAAKWAATK